VSKSLVLGELITNLDQTKEVEEPEAGNIQSFFPTATAD
jgi:hypothetical protein